MAIKFGLKAVAQIAAVVRASAIADKSEDVQPKRKGVHRQPLLEAILTADLDPASDPLTGATTTTARLIRGDTLSDQPITILNRSVDLILDSGTYVIVAFINGTWRIVWADCSEVSISTSDGSSGSGGGGGDGGDGGPYGDGGYG